MTALLTTNLGEGITTKHCGVSAVVSKRTTLVILSATLLVKAAGLAVQSVFVLPAVLVTGSVMVHT